MIKEEIALNVACDLLVGSQLYGYDYQRIYEEVMRKEGYVCKETIMNFILEHLKELGKEYFAPYGMNKKEALERIEFRVRHCCPEANGDIIGDCNQCYRYPCNDMKALLILAADEKKVKKGDTNNEK